MEEEGSFLANGSLVSPDRSRRSLDREDPDSPSDIDEEHLTSIGSFRSKPPAGHNNNSNAKSGVLSQRRPQAARIYSYSIGSVKNSKQPLYQKCEALYSRCEDQPKGQDDLKAIYSEIAQINARLKEEFKILTEKDRVLKEKENELIAAKINWDKTVSADVEQKVYQHQLEYRAEIKKFDQLVRDKDRENKRLKENFDTLKAANDTLKKQLEALQRQHAKVERQSNSLQARLANLQRKREHQERKEEFLPSHLVKERRHTKETTPKLQKPKASLSTYEVLAVLLEWVSEVHLRQSVIDQPAKPPECLSNPEYVQNKCLKVLPSLVEILKDLPSIRDSLTLPCLQFVYWSLVHMDQAQGHSKSTLASTLRRLGEELYKPRVVKFTENGSAATSSSASQQPAPASPLRVGDKRESREGTFFKSPNLHTRFLSSLIILKTLTQVDLVANVFDVLRSDLKGEPGKELFLYYQATKVCLPFLKPTNKALAHSAVDVLLQMSMESAALPGFLESCSAEPLFRAASLLFRLPGAELKLTDKLSIIFQKLSKIRSNRRYFEMYGITSAALEMLRTHGAGADNAFLALNLKSILFNLNAKPPALSAAAKPAQPRQGDSKDTGR